MSTKAEREAFQETIRLFVAGHPLRAVEAGGLAVRALGVDAEDKDHGALGLGASFAAGARTERQNLRREQRQTWRAARECERCGNEYRASRADSRYCSTRCRVAAHRALVA